MKWIDINLPFGRVWDEDSIDELDSMRKRGLVQPGMLLEMEDGEEVLVGHINPEGGVCGDCALLRGPEVVKRYCVVWGGD